jgi:hypothetical protein
MIFSFDAGMNNLPAFRENSVSPVAGFTTRIPILEFRKIGVDASESMEWRRASRGLSAGEIPPPPWVEGVHAAKRSSASARSLNDFI